MTSPSWFWRIAVFVSLCQYVIHAHYYWQWRTGLYFLLLMWSLSKNTQIVWQQLTKRAREDFRSSVIWKRRGSWGCDVATACWAAWDKGTLPTPGVWAKWEPRQVVGPGVQEGACLKNCQRLWVQDLVTSLACCENDLGHMNTPFQCETVFALGFPVIPGKALWRYSWVSFISQIRGG